MTTKLLVNTPEGVQAVIEVGEGGGYFDPARVLWDERTDGPAPAINLGGMKRSGKALVFDAALKAADTVKRAELEAVKQPLTIEQRVKALEDWKAGGK